MNAQLLTQFWVVTRNLKSISLYRAEFTKEKGATLEKIALKGDSKAKVGTVLGSASYPILCIGLAHIEPFQSISETTPAGPLSDEDVHLGAFSGNTTSVQGLFLQEETAREAFESEFRPAITVYDIAWKKHTEETVRAIGANHPFFRFRANPDSWPHEMKNVMCEIMANP